MSGDFEIGPSADRIDDVFEDKSRSEGKPFVKAAEPALSSGREKGKRSVSNAYAPKTDAKPNLTWRSQP
jgi:hypothetical protein